MIVDASETGGAELLTRAAHRFRPDAANDVEAYMASDSAMAFVATEADEVVGWCWGYALERPDGTVMAYLHQLNVAESHRRRGVAKDLVRSFCASAASRGAYKMFLMTGESNSAARALYESLGGGFPERGPTLSYSFALPLS